MQLTREQTGPRPSDKPPFVVFFLLPRVGEKNMEPCKRSVGYHVFQYLNGVVFDKADIGEPAPFYFA